MAGQFIATKRLLKDDNYSLTEFLILLNLSFYSFSSQVQW
jgi:hypothetical protein